MGWLLLTTHVEMGVVGGFVSQLSSPPPETLWWEHVHDVQIPITNSSIFQLFVRFDLLPPRICYNSNSLEAFISSPFLLLPWDNHIFCHKTKLSHWMSCPDTTDNKYGWHLRPHRWSNYDWKQTSLVCAPLSYRNLLRVASCSNLMGY